MNLLGGTVSCGLRRVWASPDGGGDFGGFLLSESLRSFTLSGIKTEVVRKVLG